MTVVINRKRCNACGNSIEPLCIRICPGDLFYKKTDGLVALRHPEECWDCASCVKACPRQAVSLVLPVEAGGQGGQLYAQKDRGGTRWVLVSPGGTEKEIKI